VLRTETFLGGFFLATWVVAVIYLAGWLEPPGLRLSLYGLFSLAAAFGWVMGNLSVMRERSLRDRARRVRLRHRALYVVVPAGLLALVRSMMPLELRAQAPLAGALAFAVYCVFFLVPVTLRPRG
jgi:hypothetical protein